MTLATIAQGAPDLPATPDDLAAAGYRIEFGGAGTPLGHELLGRYWWTWSRGSGIDCGDDFDTAEEAIEDARQDMREHAGPGGNPAAMAAALAFAAGLGNIGLDL